MALEIAPLFVGGLPGGPEMIVIFLIVILLFGANKLPKLARSSGEAIGEFKKGREQVEQELQEIQETADPTADVADEEEEETTETSTEPSTETETSTSTESSTDTETSADPDA